MVEPERAESADGSAVRPHEQESAPAAQPPLDPQAQEVAERRRQLAANARSLGPDERVIPSWTDTTVRRAASLIGGPLGRHALIGRALILTPLRVALLMALAVLILGWLVKSPCIQTGPGGLLDQGDDRPWLSGCYNDTTVIYHGRGINQGTFVYEPMFDGNGELLRVIEYPVVTALWQWATGLVTSGYLNFAETTGIVPVPLDFAAFFTIGAIALGLLYLWAVASTMSMARRRPWDVALMCLAPLLIVHAFTNWDLLPIALLAAAMSFWSRGRPVAAGIFIGLGFAAKLYPLLLLGPLLVLCFRSGRMREFWLTATATLAAWLAVNGPIMLAYPDAWKEFFSFNSARTSEYSTFYQIFTKWTGSDLFEPVLGPGEVPTVLNSVSLLAFAALCLGIGWLGLSAARRPRVAQLMFLVVAAFLLTNKVWSPQYSLWLLPLVVLALPRWKPIIIWQLVEACVWYLLMPTFAGDQREEVLPYYPFQVTVLIRDAIIITLAVLIIREILRPESDLIRISGDDDPTGGVLADTSDVRTIPSLPALWRSIRGGGRPAVDRSGGDERDLEGESAATDDGVGDQAPVVGTGRHGA